MTFTETAAAMRRLADGMDTVVRQMGKDCDTGAPKPMLSDDFAVGGAVLLLYIRDLVTLGTRESFDRGTLLVLLETISRDKELFPSGVAQAMWNAEEVEA